MASRDGVVVRAEVPCDGGVSPNRKIPAVTVEIRLFWPDKATEDEVAEALLQALGKTNLAYYEKRATLPNYGRVWPVPPPDDGPHR